MEFSITVSNAIKIADDVIWLDVREMAERQICKLPYNDTHIPIGDIPIKYDELDKDSHIIVYCHHGIRSANVTSFLLSKGFKVVQNLRGGIDKWAIDIEPTMARY